MMSNNNDFDAPSSNSSIREALAAARYRIRQGVDPSDAIEYEFRERGIREPERGSEAFDILVTGIVRPGRTIFFGGIKLVRELRRMGGTQLPKSIRPPKGAWLYSLPDVEWEFVSIDVYTATSTLRGLLVESMKARNGSELVEMWLRDEPKVTEGRVEVMLGSSRIGYIAPSDVARSRRMMALHASEIVIVNARFHLDGPDGDRVQIAMPKF